MNYKEFYRIVRNIVNEFYSNRLDAQTALHEIAYVMDDVNQSGTVEDEEELDELFIEWITEEEE